MKARGIATGKGMGIAIVRILKKKKDSMDFI